jgi:phosphoglycerate dehydrogenase-like enzyme
VTGPGVSTPIERAHRNLGDHTLGIIGLGQIGAEIARRCASFGMRVLAVDPVSQLPVEGVAELWPPEDLNRLLAESDFVVIAAPHTPQTEQLFGREQLRSMRLGAYLINIGRS